MTILRGQATAGKLEVSNTAGGTMITGVDNVSRVRVLALRSALGLECKGIQRSRGSVYAIVKREFGFKGSKQKVYDQLDKWIKDNITR